MDGLTWLVVVGIILATIIGYTFILLLTLRAVYRGQKGTLLFNIPVAPFSVKARIYTIAKQLGVEEDEVTYVGDAIYKVGDVKYTVEGFFGVVVYKLNEDLTVVGAVDDKIPSYNYANLRGESGDVEADESQTLNATPKKEESVAESVVETEEEPKAVNATEEVKNKAKVNRNHTYGTNGKRKKKRKAKR